MIWLQHALGDKTFGAIFAVKSIDKLLKWILPQELRTNIISSEVNEEFQPRIDPWFIHPCFVDKQQLCSDRLA